MKAGAVTAIRTSSRSHGPASAPELVRANRAKVMSQTNVRDRYVYDMKNTSCAKSTSTGAVALYRMELPETYGEDVGVPGDGRATFWTESPPTTSAGASSK